MIIRSAETQRESFIFFYLFIFFRLKHQHLAQIFSGRYFTVRQLLKSQTALLEFYSFIRPEAASQERRIRTGGLALSAARTQTGAYLSDEESRIKGEQLKRQFQSRTAGSLSRSVGGSTLQSKWQRSQWKAHTMKHGHAAINRFLRQLQKAEVSGSRLQLRNKTSQNSKKDFLECHWPWPLPEEMIKITFRNK